MKLYVKTLEGKTIELNVLPDETIDNVKIMILDATECPIDKQKLMFANKELENGKTLRHYKLEKESGISLLIKLSVGGLIWKKDDVNVSIKKFGARFKQYKSIIEEQKIDVGYYIGQSCNDEINEERMQFKIKIAISENLNEDWIKSIEQALKLINQCAPGLKLEGQMSDKPIKIERANSIYVTTNTNDEAFTEGNIFTGEITTISLGNSWKWNKQGTVLHEIMHALGFHHGRSQKDRDRFVKSKKLDDDNFSIISFSKELIPFDKFSVMLYNENESMEQVGDSIIWKLKKDSEQPNNLSELDKVSLNILYPPVITKGEYDPKLGRTGLYYCGRPVMKGHNHPDDDIGEGVCGPKSGPNCPACRTLKTEKMDKINLADKFQGYSGMIYCGGKIKMGCKFSDRRCGPDNGQSGDECLTQIFNESEIKDYKEKIGKRNKKTGEIF